MNFVFNLMKVQYYEGPNLPPAQRALDLRCILVSYFASLFVIYILSLHLCFGWGLGRGSWGRFTKISFLLLSLFRERKCSGTGNWKVSIIYHLGKTFRWVRLLLFHLFHLASSE